MVKCKKKSLVGYNVLISSHVANFNLIFLLSRYWTILVAFKVRVGQFIRKLQCKLDSIGLIEWQTCGEYNLVFKLKTSSKPQKQILVALFK